MLLILPAAAAVSALTGMLSGESEWAETIIILVVVLLNALLGVIQEQKAEAAIEALQSMMATEMGKIAGVISAAKEEQTPLQKKPDDLGGLLSKMVLGICVFLFAFNLFICFSFCETYSTLSSNIRHTLLRPPCRCTWSCRHKTSDLCCS